MAIRAGIVLAFALLRPRKPRLQVQLVTGAAGEDGSRVPTNFDIEEKAA
jgi:hypothetical protein